MTVFSPSSTEDFLRCPLYWQLRRTGLQSRRLGKKELAGILGTAFATSVGAYNTEIQNGVSVTNPKVHDYADIGCQMIQQHLHEADEAGMVTEDVDRLQRDRLMPRLRTAITEFVKVDPRPPAWTVRDVELTLVDGGNGRLDLGCANDLGAIVIDYKTKLTADPKYLPRDVETWQFSEQRWHYSYFYGQHAGLPVWQFAICLVVLEPKFRVHWFNWVNQPEILRDWYERRRITWERMAMVRDGELPAEMAAQHHTQFGPCQYRRHCFEHHGDVELTTSSGDYIVNPKGA